MARRRGQAGAHVRVGIVAGASTVLSASCFALAIRVRAAVLAATEGSAARPVDAPHVKSSHDRAPPAGIPPAAQVVDVAPGGSPG